MLRASTATVWFIVVVVSDGCAPRCRHPAAPRKGINPFSVTGQPYLLPVPALRFPVTRNGYGQLVRVADNGLLVPLQLEVVEFHAGRSPEKRNRHSYLSFVTQNFFNGAIEIGEWSFRNRYRLTDQEWNLFLHLFRLRVICDAHDLPPAGRRQRPAALPAPTTYLPCPARSWAS